MLIKIFIVKQSNIRFRVECLTSTTLLEQLAEKTISKEDLFRKAQADSSLIPVLIEGISSPKAAIRYGCAKVLMDLSEKHPGELYSYMDRFIGLLDSKYRILTWNALAIIANLTKVDKDKKFDAIFDKYYGFLGNEYMVTVANTVANSAKIAANKPYLADNIASELLKVQNLQTTPHLTEECKLVIAQQAIETFNNLIKFTQNKEALISFAQMHKNSPRTSLRKEAQRFIKKWDKAGS